MAQAGPPSLTLDQGDRPGASTIADWLPALFPRHLRPALQPPTVLRRPGAVVPVGGPGAQGPIGVLQGFAPDGDESGLLLSEDNLGLRGLDDQAHGDGGDADLLPDGVGERHSWKPGPRFDGLRPLPAVAEPLDAAG